MTLLHACILLRDFKSFQRLLNVHGRQSQPSREANDDSRPVKGESEDGDRPLLFYVGGRSPPKHDGVGALGTASVNVNEKDRDGRTALHVAVSLPECLEYVRLLLKHPSIHVNVPDAESHYTPLHRALYIANLPAALSVFLFSLLLLLLQRSDIDATLKDNEGYTAFDLYNSTVEGTKPERGDTDAELFMWGANVNATLGFSDGNNRSHPDQIVIQPKEYALFPEDGPTLQDRFSPIHVRHVGMSKLHTVVVTASEGTANNVGGGNLRVCGFGSSGRLGPSPYHRTQQYALSCLPAHAFPPNVQIEKVAVGQDHTLVLTKSGEVYSWGLNRFAQLGYVIRTAAESPSNDGRIVEAARRDHWEGKTESSLDDTFQQTPRRVLDALRKETVVGVAASKMASACWTVKGDMFTWGTNSGQLGYERSSQPQVLPRKVSKIVGPVVDVALSDTAMACVLITGDVMLLWSDKDVKINFPLPTFPAKIQAYRPPQAVRDAGIAKVTTCDGVFAALSLSGEVFVFTAPDGNTSSGDSARAARGKTALIKPQKVWVLKKKYRAVRDVALGANGNIIVCTESGHVFVRTRTPTKAPPLTVQSSDKAGSTPGSFTSSSLTGGTAGGLSTAAGSVQPGKIGTNFAFVRVPCLQRITNVCSNSAGAFGALKVDYRHAPIDVCGNSIAEDLRELMPFVVMYGEAEWRSAQKGGRFGLNLEKSACADSSAQTQRSPSAETDPEDGDLEDVRDDILQLRRLCKLVEQEKKESKAYPKDRRLPFDADVMVVTQSDAAFPAHRVILAARSAELCILLSGGKAVKDDKTNISVRFIVNKGKRTSTFPRPCILTCGKLYIGGCHAVTILILLTYLYSDTLPALWDPRVKTELQKECARVKVKPDQVKAELQVLAKLLNLPLLSEALDVWIKRVPTASMAKDMRTLWSLTRSFGQKGEAPARKAHDPLAPDVVLQLMDREVWCHSVVLRARSDLFASFFGEEVWTMNRWDDEGIIKVNMRHLTWDVMQYVFEFMFCGTEEAQFDRLDFVKSVDDVLDFMFSVVGAATELLLDRLALICSTVILKHVNIQNAPCILSDAVHYNANQLTERLMTYMAVNIETLLEQRMLDDFPHRLIKQLAAFTRRKQAEKSPVSRTTVLVDAAMRRHANWLSLQDFPEPIVRFNRPQWHGGAVASKKSRLSSASTIPIPVPDSLLEVPVPQRSIRRPPSGEDLFIMDDAEGASPGKPVWKPHSVPRVDMKSVMEEAAALFISPSRMALPVSRTGSKDGVGTTPSPASSLPRTSSTSWRVPANPTTIPRNPTLGSPPVSGTIQASLTPPMSEDGGIARGIHKPRPNALPSPATPSRSSRSQAYMESQSSLGPMISPTRQPSKTTDVPTIRRVSGKAWALPAVEPVIATSPPSPHATSGVSFVAIQQLQLEQSSAGSSKDKRSLRDIQAEEEAKQQEAEFLRWWTAEEERVRLESEALSRAAAESKAEARKAKRKGRSAKEIQGKPEAQNLPQRDQAATSAEDRRTKAQKPRRAKKSNDVDIPS